MAGHTTGGRIKIQMRKLQFRWKSGTAVTAANEVEYEGSSSVEKDGGVSQEEETDAANACHSFWDEAGSGAGAIGT